MKFLFKISHFLQNMASKLEKFLAKRTQDEDGKPKATFSSKNIGIVASTLIVSLIVYSLLADKDDNTILESVETLKKETEVNLPVIAQTNNSKEENVPVFDFDEFTKKLEQPKSNLPTVERCEELLKKVSAVGREGITSDELDELSSCIDNKVLKLTDLQMKALEALLDPDSNLTPEERALLADLLSGKITDPNDPRMTILKALLSGDPERARIARLLLSGNLTEAEKALLLKALRGEIPMSDIAYLLEEDTAIRDAKRLLESGVGLTEAERKKLQSFIDGDITESEVKNILNKGIAKMLEESNKANKAGNLGELTEEERLALLGALNDPNTSPEMRKLIKDVLAGKTDKRQFFSITKKVVDSDSIVDQISDLENKIKENELSKNKLLKGQTLSPEELNSLNNNSKYKSDLTSLKASLRKYEDVIKAKMLSENEKNRKMAEKLGFSSISTVVIVPKKPEVAKVKKLSPDEQDLYEMINRKKEYETSKKGNRRLASSLEKNNARAPSLVASFNPNKEFTIPSGVKIKCYNSSAVYVTSENLSQNFLEIKCLEDIYDVRTMRRVYAKNEILYGKITAILESTSSVNAEITHIVRDGEKIPFKARISYNSGGFGIPGTILTNRNQKIIASVLADTVSKASEAVVSQFENNIDSENASLAELGQLMGIQAGASSFNTIAEYLAKDLEKTPIVFLATSGTKLFITTE